MEEKTLQGSTAGILNYLLIMRCNSIRIYILAVLNSS